MGNNKKPDNVVFDTETQKYDASLKPYTTNVGAPSITTSDTIAWKKRSINKLNHKVQTWYQEIKAQHDQLMEEFEFNNLIYNAKFAFEPLLARVIIYTSEIMMKFFYPLSLQTNAILIQWEVSYV